MDKIKLTINGTEILANNGDTVLTAAKNAGIEIPPFATTSLLRFSVLAVFVLLRLRAYPSFFVLAAQRLVRVW